VPEHFQGLPRRPNAALLYIFQSLANAFRCIGLRVDVEKKLMSFDMLYDWFCLGHVSANLNTYFQRSAEKSRMGHARMSETSNPAFSFEPETFKVQVTNIHPSVPTQIEDAQFN
jgi:hypothetical protein